MPGDRALFEDYDFFRKKNFPFTIKQGTTLILIVGKSWHADFEVDFYSVTYWGFFHFFSFDFMENLPKSDRRTLWENRLEKFCVQNAKQPPEQLSRC